MMKRPFVIAVAFVLVMLGFCTSGPRSADAGGISPLTGEIGYSGKGNEPTGGVFLSPAHIMSALVSGGLYGTDGSDLYLIDKATGTTTLIGPHGPVEFWIGGLAFDNTGVLYGISLGSDAQLYTIDPTTGAATAVGPLGVGSVFEGGLDFDASDQLFGVDQGNDSNARTITINKVTGAAKILGPTPGENRDINGLAFDGRTFYAIDRVSNTFGSVDPTTGAYMPIGNPGAIIGDSGGLAIDPADGTVYATFAGTGGFYTINKTTGSATLISTSSADYGLAFAPSIDLPPATKTIIPSTGLPGTPLTCTITLGNSGVANMTNVQVTDTLPISLTYVDHSLTATSGSYGEANGVITWTGAIRANAVITVTFGIAISDDASPDTVVTNTAIISTPSFTLERSAAVTVTAGDKTPETSAIYLPLALRHYVTPVTFPLHIGDAIPGRAVAYRGEIFYTKSVLIPSSLPIGGHFYFSSSPSQVSAVLVDDDLVILLDGTSYFVYHFSPGGRVPQSAIVEVPRATMEQLAGQTATVEYRDVYACVVQASSMWLIWTP